MKSYLAICLLSLTVSAQAEIREIYLPHLNCGAHEFQDVTITYNDTPATRKELTVGKLCEKLAQKLLRKKGTSEVIRFIADEMAPKQIDRYTSRANDFFRLVLFKRNIIHKNSFDYTDDVLEDILTSLETKSRLRVTTFSPDASQMMTIAFHQGGTAYFNEHKLHRSACSQINTLVHEYMHFVGYSHGDNRPEGKENSVPYYFGNRAEELCKAGVI